jgi:hypothetical protein
MNSDAAAARRAFVVSRRFIRRLRDPRSARSVKTMVLVNGQDISGFLVMDGEG